MHGHAQVHTRGAWNRAWHVLDADQSVSYTHGTHRRVCAHSLHTQTSVHTHTFLSPYYLQGFFGIKSYNESRI